MLYSLEAKNLFGGEMEMNRYVPVEKRPKKQKRAYFAQQRGSWNGLNPVTRRSKNPKAYQRQKSRKIGDVSYTFETFDFQRESKNLDIDSIDKSHLIAVCDGSPVLPASQQSHLCSVGDACDYLGGGRGTAA